MKKEKNVLEVKMHTFLVCTCKSRNFAQSQKIFVRSHDRETVTFKNPVSTNMLKIKCLALFWLWLWLFPMIFYLFFLDKLYLLKYS